MIHYEIGYWPSQLHIVIYTQIIGLHINLSFLYFDIHACKSRLTLCNIC